MGGFGSGRHSGKDKVSSMVALDIRRWKRDGVLVPGYTGQWKWSRRGIEFATIQFRVEQGSVRLMYKTRSRGAEWQDKDYLVRLELTPCAYGGERVWFLCPCCNRRVALLYGGGMFACRQCHHLAYDCQSERSDDRACRQVDKLRERLKWESGLLNGKGWKPKWMRWHTFRQLEVRHDEQMRRVVFGMRQRFGAEVDNYFV